MREHLHNVEEATRHVRHRTRPAARAPKHVPRGIFPTRRVKPHLMHNTSINSPRDVEVPLYGHMGRVLTPSLRLTHPHFRRTFSDIYILSHTNEKPSPSSVQLSCTACYSCRLLMAWAPNCPVLAPLASPDSHFPPL